MTFPLTPPELGHWALALAVWLGSGLILIAAKRLALRWLTHRHPNPSQNPILLGAVKSLKSFFFWALGFAIGISYAPVHWGSAIKDVLIVVVGLQILITGSDLIVPISAFAFRRSDVVEVRTAQNALNVLLRVVLWVAVVLLILENLGVKITTLVAGLGVGGIAAGLALQNVASDLFASLSIMWDKPFQIGDFITISTFSGTVERVGIQTTRLRSVAGEELIFPNTYLVTGQIHNYKRMEERRVLFAVGVTYDTSPEQLRAIPELIKNIIAAQSHTRFDRAHFKDFGPSSLDFEIVYYVLTPDYTTYMDIQQAINLALLNAFEERHIAFAFPTQTIIVAPNNAGEEPAVPSPPDES